MKNILGILTIITAISFTEAQVAIGKKTVTGTDTLLDFGSDNNKGLVLPWVTNLNSNTTGTLYYDTKDGKVKCTGVDATIDLSVRGLDTPFSTTHADYINNYTEHNSSDLGTVIGSETTTKKGVLVIEPTSADPAKGIILPIVTDYSKIGVPAPGTLVYDSSIAMVCVYDGEKWAFWGKK